MSSITDVAAKKITIRKQPIRDFGAIDCYPTACFVPGEFRAFRTQSEYLRIYTFFDRDATDAASAIRSGANRIAIES
jgi:hypothetical protein